MPPYPHLMARYNRWMNEKIYTACDSLSDADRKLDRKAPFNSIHGLLDHLYVMDSMWLTRFGVNDFELRPINGWFFEDYNQLKTARFELDTKIEEWASKLTEAKLSEPLHFVSVIYPEPRTLPNYLAVMHFFNHKTHHRGQATALLEQIDVDFGITDMAMMPDVRI